MNAPNSGIAFEIAERFARRALSEVPSPVQRLGQLGRLQAQTANAYPSPGAIGQGRDGLGARQDHKDEEQPRHDDHG